MIFYGYRGLLVFGLLKVGGFFSSFGLYSDRPSYVWGRDSLDNFFKVSSVAFGILFGHP